MPRRHGARNLARILVGAYHHGNMQSVVCLRDAVWTMVRSKSVVRLRNAD